MDNEPYRDLTHDEAAEAIYREALANGYHAFREFKLPNGRIADVIVRDHKYLITIYEVKTLFRGSLVSEANAKYRHWCNHLYFVVPGLTQQAAPRLIWEMCDFPEGQPVGLIGAHRDGMAILRPSIIRPILAERLVALSQSLNKAVSLGEARLL